MATRFSTDVISKAAQGRFRILDAGCGTGAHAFYLARQNTSRLICGYDVSQEVIEKATRYRERLHAANVTFVVANHDDFNPPYPADMIYTCESLIDENETSGRHTLDAAEEIIKRRVSRFRTMLTQNGIYVVTWGGIETTNDDFVKLVEGCGMKSLDKIEGGFVDYGCEYDLLGNLCSVPMFRIGLVFESS